ncbi:hypothetical protein ACIP5U_34005 [Streptomyces sp. NPDC088788]|uniref:hypothetical protein n=1 Tax=Streptomyces sp. NPDC088788 TaxID=3365898 RepID=UPI0037F1F510
MTSNKQFKRDARALAASMGTSYTDACWRLRNQGGAEPSGGDSDTARYGWQEVTVAALSALVAEHGVVPVTVMWSPAARTPAAGPEAVRWGVAEPAVDGWLIREVTAPLGVVEKGTRVPVPRRLPDGTISFIAVWPLVCQTSRAPFWRFVHNGWSVERPGHFPEGLDPLPPSPDLPYEVRVFDVPDGVVGDDHHGGVPDWSTRAWCTDLARARQLSDAYVAHRIAPVQRPGGGDCGYLRAEVWQHTTTDRSVQPDRVHHADAAPDRTPRAASAVRHLAPGPARVPRTDPGTGLVPTGEAPPALRTEGVGAAVRLDIPGLDPRRTHSSRYHHRPPEGRRPASGNSGTAVNAKPMIMGSVQSGHS